MRVGSLPSLSKKRRLVVEKRLSSVPLGAICIPAAIVDFLLEISMKYPKEL